MWVGLGSDLHKNRAKHALIWCADLAGGGCNCFAAQRAWMRPNGAGKQSKSWSNHAVPTSRLWAARPVVSRCSRRVGRHRRNGQIVTMVLRRPDELRSATRQSAAGGPMERKPVTTIVRCYRITPCIFRSVPARWLLSVRLPCRRSRSAGSAAGMH